jgi:Phosphopantetheinyl transferase
MTGTPWQPAPSKPILGKSDIHVWRAPLNISRDLIESFAPTLATDEQTRASRFHFDRHRTQFVAARGWLRSILGSYLNIRPDELNFTYSSYGKPSLQDLTSTQLRFNVAHSGDFALYAFVLGHDIGVDVELIKSEFARETIAKQFFCANEVAALLAFPEGERPHAFFDCWTRKEAFIKAQGIGLSLPLDEFEVSLKHDEPALLHANWDSAEATRWLLMKIDVAPGYAATLAVPAGDYRIQYFHVDERAISGEGLPQA